MAIDGKSLSEYVQGTFQPDEIAVNTDNNAQLRYSGDKRTGDNAIGALMYNLEQENSLKFEAVLDNEYLEVECSSPGVQKDGYEVTINSEEFDDIAEIEEEVKKLRKVEELV